MAKVWRRKDRDIWVADFRDAKGCRVRQTAPTREEADELLAEGIQESRQAAPPVQDRNIPFDAYAAHWLERVASSIAPKTLSCYQQMLRLHLLPEFERTKVRAIHRGRIKDLLARKRSEGLSKNTVRLIRATLSVMLADAMDDGLLKTNPTYGINRGRKGPHTITQADRQKEIRPMTAGQLATFFAAAPDPFKEPTCSRRELTLFLVLADAGLRPGEALALQWEDFDFADRALRVERAMSAGQAKVTKTEKTRVVDLTLPLAEALNQWQAEVEAEALTRNANPSPLDLRI